MSYDGKALENLVRQIEELLLPDGFSVKGNSRIFNDDGVQIAEFDVEIRGRLGSTDIAWLIECRDRPGSGAAPTSWIEQLVGRRDHFGFNKVTAVSSTGFAGEATNYARESGIELRTVADIRAEDVVSWLGLQHIHRHEQVTHLEAATLFVADGESSNHTSALAQRLQGCTGDTTILRSSESGELISFTHAFHAAVFSRESLFDDVQPNDAGKPIRVRARYPNDKSHFIVDTECGPVRIKEIGFRGKLLVRETDVPIASLQEYRRAESGDRISQTASFPLEVHGTRFSLELHNLADTGETHVVLRKIS